MFSSYLANKMLDLTLKGVAFTAIANGYVALTTVSNPATASEAAYTGAEVTGGSYARQMMTVGTASTKQDSNTNALTWTNLPAGTITAVMIFDAVSGGNLLYYGPLSAPATIAAGGGYQLPASTLINALT